MSSEVTGVQELKEAATARDIVREVKWNLTQSYAKARQGHGSEKLTHFLSVPRRTLREVVPSYDGGTLTRISVLKLSVKTFSEGIGSPC